MIQLEITDGAQPARKQHVVRFPLMIGRGGDAGLRIESPGVWDRHLALELNSAATVVAIAQPNAVTLVNGEQFAERALRNGDSIQIGSVKLRFWLASAAQRNLRLREALTWIGLAGVAILEIGLVYWLAQ